MYNVSKTWTPELSTTKTAPHAKRYELAMALERAAYDYNLRRSAVLNARPGGIVTVNGRREGLTLLQERVREH